MDDFATLLKPDCARCAALCCIALAFDKSEAFPIDKPNGEPCPNLKACGQCQIYETREAEGYRGCIAFDCHGAGQRVTQDVFSGKSWQQDPALLPDMIDAFVILRRIHEQLVLLHQARRLPLTDDELERLCALVEALSPQGEWTQADLRALPVGDVESDIRAFLMSLRHHLV